MRNGSRSGGHDDDFLDATEISVVPKMCVHTSFLNVY